MNSPYWFELAVMFGLMAVGNIVFAQFAEGQPKWQRVVKVVVGGGIAVLVSATAGRGWFFVLLGVMSGLVIIIHAWWLPKHGMNCWTAESGERYYALRGWKMK